MVPIKEVYLIQTDTPLPDVTKGKVYASFTLPEGAQQLARASKVGVKRTVNLLSGDHEYDIYSVDLSDVSVDDESLYYVVGFHKGYFWTAVDATTEVRHSVNSLMSFVYSYILNYWMLHVIWIVVLVLLVLRRVRMLRSVSASHQNAFQ